MKLLLIGDPHFKVDNELETNVLYTETLRAIQENNFDVVVILGDVLDTHNRSDMRAFIRAQKYLRGIRDCVKELIVIIGNHDRENNNDFLTENSFFWPLKEWDRTYIVDQVLHRSYPSPAGDINLIFVPYVPPGRFKEALQTISFDFTQANAIFAHQEFAGAQMNKITSNEGDEWPYNYPVVYSGHVHEYQVLQPNLIYVGTPLQHGFTDNIDKKFMIAHVKAGDITANFSRLDIKLLIKRKINLTLEELYDFEPKKDEIIKIVLTGDSKSIREALKREDVKEKLKGCRVTFKDPHKTKHINSVPLYKSHTKFSDTLKSKIISCSKGVIEEYENLFGELPDEIEF